MSLPSELNAQQQKTWQWIKQLGGDSWDISAGVVCDSKNNLYVAGSFFNTLNCGSKKIKSVGNRDVFVAKFNEKGDLKDIWTGGGKNNDNITCISTTSEDNVVIGGVISDTAIFDKQKINGIGQRLFVADLDLKGKYAWISTISVNGSATMYSICADRQGNIYVSGVFNNTLLAGSQKIKTHGGKDIFIARLNKTGTVEKLFALGSEGNDSPGSLSVDNSDNLFIAGVLSEPFENDSIKYLPGSSLTTTYAYLIKFDFNFNKIWSRSISGENYCQISSVKNDVSGNIYVCGSFNLKLHLIDTVLVSKGRTDAFLLKYNSEGKREWCRSFGSWYYDYANNINIDNLGGAYVTGSLGDTLLIDSLVVIPVLKNNSTMIVQFSSTGKALWSETISGNGRNFSNGSVLDTKGNLYLTGSFRKTFEKNDKKLSSLGDQDIFLAKFYNCPSNKAEVFGRLSFCPRMDSELSTKKGFKNIVWNDTLKGTNYIIARSPGYYWVSMSDKQGCLLTDTVFETQNSLPVFSLGRDTTIKVGDSLILRAPVNYTQYQWQDYSTFPTFLVKPKDKESGNKKYWLSVTDSALCNYTDTISVTFIKGNKWIDLENIKLTVYPNPTSDKVYWYINTDKICQFLIQLTDENGRILYHRYLRDYISGEVKDISMSGLPSGTYHIRICDTIDGKNFKTSLVIKQ